MNKLKNLLQKIFSLDTDMDTFENIHNGILKGMEIKGSNFIILIAAIIIASVGLNTNSTAVVIGAMLISPIMGSIISMGYALAIVDNVILKKGVMYFIIQMIVAIIASTLYFLLSPVKIPSPELTARITPTFFDLIVAFFGGVAGVIALTRKEKTNVIPGVAIATALMPPLCTVGYGIANGSVEYITGAGYLFIINSFYIIVATMLITTILRTTGMESTVLRLDSGRKKIFTVLFLVVTIPSIFSGYFASRNVALQYKVQTFCTQEINSSIRNVVNEEIDSDKKIIEVTVIGEAYSLSEVDELNDQLDEYGIEGYKLVVIQSE